MEQKIMELANIVAMAENDEKDAFIKGILSGNKLSLDLHLKIEDGEIKNVVIGRRIIYTRRWRWGNNGSQVRTVPNKY